MVSLTYAAWINLLRQFAAGDDQALNEMELGSFTIDAGTAARFYQQVEDAYRKRKESWLNKFKYSFEVGRFKTEDDFGIALRNSKQNLYPLVKFVDLKAFPQDLKQMLKKDLADFMAEIRKSLKDNVSKISNGRESMLLLLNSFTVIDFSQPLVSDQGNNQSVTNINSGTGRKIIF